MTARERFKAKCEFMPGSGCVLWRGGTTGSHGNTERTGVFWHEGKKVLARRFAAEHIHGLDLLGKEVTVTCGDPLCVEHIQAENTGVNVPQFYVFVNIGLADAPTKRQPPNHSDIPMHREPSWLSS